MISIELLGLLKKKQPVPDWVFSTEDIGGRTIEDILKSVGADFSLMSYMILADGSRKKRDHIPQDGEKIKIMPLTAGG